MDSNAASHSVFKVASVACSECRAKHLKCDGALGADGALNDCSRCVKKGLQCIWVASRRGAGAKKAQTQPQHNGGMGSNYPSSFGHGFGPNAVQSQPTSSHGQGFDPGAFHSQPMPSFNQGFGLGAVHSQPMPFFGHGPGAVDYQQAMTGIGALQMMSPAETLSDPNGSSPETSTPSTFEQSNPTNLRSEEEHLLNSYYNNFHAAHPILVPRGRHNASIYPNYLKAVVEFIGAHYAEKFSGDSRKQETAVVLGQCEARTPEMVQALLLYAVALHARFEPDEAMDAMHKAMTIATEIEMNAIDFASNYSNGDPVREESLRRTWWELFVIDGYLAALHRNDTFLTNDVPLAAFLPCDDISYNNNAIMPPAASLLQFENRSWEEGEPRFSSYSYRIGAIRILTRVSEIRDSNEVPASVVQDIDSAIASWKIAIPKDKADIIGRSGDGDQLMFQAFAFINLATILLHFPRSELPIGLPKSAEITCTTKHMQQVAATCGQHSVIALTASRATATLANLPVKNHSPLFICGLVFACMTQLAACHQYPQDPSTQDKRESVGLILGMLKSFRQNWVIAQNGSQLLRTLASDVFNPVQGASIDMGQCAGAAQEFPALNMFFYQGMQHYFTRDAEPAGHTMPT